MWYHKSSLDWMKARQHYITASDFMKVQGKKYTKEHIIDVYAGKHEDLTEESCESFGAAARGHLLEPYAIELFNTTSISGTKLYHWDDIVVTTEDKVNKVGFSPDAISIRQRIDSPEIVISSKYTRPVEIGEIKSYGAEKHIKKCLADPKKIEERYQIAFAMYVWQNITVGHLIFYNPAFRRAPLFSHHYSRQNLEKEIKEIEDTVRKLRQDLDDLEDSMIPSASVLEEAYNIKVKTEEEIIDERMCEDIYMQLHGYPVSAQHE